MNNNMSEHLLQDERQLTQNFNRDFRELSKHVRNFDRDLTTIGTAADTEIWRSNLRRRIDNVTHQCKTLHQSLLALEQHGTNAYQTEKLKKQFTKEIDRLKEIVQKINVKERQFKPRGSTGHANEKTPLSNSNDFNPNNPLQSNQQSSQQQAQSQDFQVAVDVDELERREEKVHGLLGQLEELNEIYGDLHELVNDQQEHIDHLGENVESAKEDVQSGVEQLDKAAKHQKAARKKMCYILIFILIVAAVIVIVYFANNKN